MSTSINDTYRRTAERLRELAAWLETPEHATRPESHVVALDFYRLSAELASLANTTREIATAYSGGIAR